MASRVMIVISHAPLDDMAAMHKTCVAPSPPLPLPILCLVVVPTSVQSIKRRVGGRGTV